MRNEQEWWPEEKEEEDQEQEEEDDDDDERDTKEWEMSKYNRLYNLLYPVWLELEDEKVRVEDDVEDWLS